MYPKSVAVGTGTTQVITFTGSVIGNWYGNAISGIFMYLGNETTGFNNLSGTELLKNEGGNVRAFLTSTSSTANSTPNTTSATFEFTLKLSATATSSSVLKIEPKIFLPIQP